jgi:hypothetical protein
MTMRATLMMLLAWSLSAAACDTQDSGTGRDDGGRDDTTGTDSDTTVPDDGGTETPTDGPADLPPDVPADTPVDTADAPIDTPEDVPPLDPTCGIARGNTSRGELAPVESPAEILGDSPAPRYVHLSWLSNPSTSMAFTWTTKDSGAGAMTEATVVDVCEDAGMTAGCLRVDNAHSGPGIGAVWHLPYSSGWKTVHKAEVCGLRPSTTYYYRVGGVAGTDEAFSPVAPFTTAPTPGSTARFTFVAMGDSRGAPDKLARTLGTAITAEAPAFIVFGGDFIEDGTRQSEWDAVFEQSEEWMRSTPILPAVGNHEKAAVAFHAQFLLPGDQNWYSLEYANAVFVNLNDCWSGAGLMGTYGVTCGGAMTQPGAAKDNQSAFMDAVFGGLPDRPYRFVTHHRPTYSETSDLTHGGSFNNDLKTAWTPVFDRNNVTMVFNGHDHFYQRSVPIRADRAVGTPEEGVNYVVTAGAGATLYDVRSSSMVAATRSAIHYVAITIDGGALDFRAVELSPDTGEAIGVIDSFSMAR